MQNMSSSRAGDLLRCPRLHYYRWICRIDPVRRAEPLRAGTAWGLAAARAADGIGDAVNALYDYMDVGEIDPMLYEQLKAMIQSYGIAYGDTLAEEKILKREHRFELPIVNPRTRRSSRTFRLVGYLDYVYQDGDGRPRVREHKSTTWDIAAGGLFWSKLRMDRQASIYTDVLIEMFGEAQRSVGIEYCVARRPSLKPAHATPEKDRKYTKGKRCKRCKGEGVDPQAFIRGAPCTTCEGSGWAEAPRLYSSQRDRDETGAEYGARCQRTIAKNPRAYFARGDIVRTRTESRRWHETLWSICEMAKRLTAIDSSPQNDASCVSYGSRCAYYDVCSGVASIDDPTRFLHRPRRKAKTNGSQ